MRQAILITALVAASVAGAAVRAGEPTDEQQLARRIDQHIEQRHREAGVRAAPLADDAEFLRRAYLDLAGRIPPLAEVRVFPDDKTPDKRARLVRKLLESPAHAEHFTNVWRDRLVPEAANSADLQLQGQLNAFNAWLRKQVTDNVPYDRMVRELLTVPFGAERVRRRMIMRPAAPADPAAPSPVAFYLGKGAKPEELAASTARVFLGVRIECAQCHNHPMASWTREDFWGFAAFFAGLQREAPEAGGGIREVFDRREIKIPGGLANVEARFLDETEPRWRYNVGARATLAEWVTAPANSYFARAAVNRLWAQLFGLGLVEPVDDFRPDNPPSHPGLLDELVRQFTAHRFDMRFLIRAITASQAYQRTSAAPGRRPAGTPDRLFMHMAVKGLTAEQFFDSLATATGYEEPSAGPPAPGQPQRMSARTEFLTLFASPGQTATEAQRSIQQALTLMNGGFIADATRIRGTTLKNIATDCALDAAGRVEALFLATLSRRPTAAEARRFGKYVADGGPYRDANRALGDVFWVLLNSAEFSLNH
jgi:hypothetical protein